MHLPVFGIDVSVCRCRDAVRRSPQSLLVSALLNSLARTASLIEQVWGRYAMVV